MSRLPQVLHSLLEELVQVRDGLRSAVSPNGTPLEKWSDEEFIYLEADLNAEPCPDIDVCFHGSRAFISIRRSPDGPTSSRCCGEWGRRDDRLGGVP
jgi:hypothetical protein